MKKKIVLIEDDESLGEAIVDALEHEGFCIEIAHNGSKGVELVKNALPDLILCDILMPEMNGYQVYEQIIANESTAFVPFIFLTALSDSFNQRKGMNLGADDYIAKPFALKDLLQTIYTRLGKSDRIKSQGEKRLNELRERLIYTIPHELKTPLHGILGFAQLISGNVNTYSLCEIKNMAESIKHAGLRLNTVLNNYLVYAKYNLNPELDQDTLYPIWVRASILDCAIKVADKHCRLEDLILNISEAKISIKLTDLEYLITELTENAFKFSNPNDTVVIENAISDLGLEIKIIDRGPGFPVEKFSEIGAFNQFDRKRFEQQGCGLGLVTSKLIIKKYKGKLLINNNKPGTTVSILIPL